MVCHAGGVADGVAPSGATARVAVGARCARGAGSCNRSAAMSPPMAASAHAGKSSASSASPPAGSTTAADAPLGSSIVSGLGGTNTSPAKYAGRAAAAPSWAAPRRRRRRPACDSARRAASSQKRSKRVAAPSGVASAPRWGRACSQASTQSVVCAAGAGRLGAAACVWPRRAHAAQSAEARGG